METPKIEELNKLYQDAHTSDEQIFAEQRSNLLLVSGDHYNRQYSKYWHRIRDNRNLSDQQKIRLTKNHTQVISKKYKNNIYSHAPGVFIGPKIEADLQCQKSAEHRNAVWQDAKVKYKLNKRIREWVSDFIDIGEVAVKIFFNPEKGQLKGYEFETDEEGAVLLDEMGHPIKSEKPIYTGGFEFERVYGMNLLRDPAAKAMDESPWLLIRKMVDIKTLKRMVQNDPDKVKHIEVEQDDTYMVFDNTMLGYKYLKDQTMLKELYYRPSFKYPNGYYYFYTQGGILFEGELPFGIFPIIYQGFDEIQTSARSRSIIKQLRPYQAEINRAGSKMAEHQVTLGDDKLLIQSGTTLAHGGMIPGVRGVTYTGAPPMVMPGRSGDQYLGHINQNIEEMYRIAQIAEDSLEKQAQLDPYTLLYRSLAQKKTYSMYASKFSEFLCDVCENYLQQHKQYCTPEDFILAVGKNEQINIEEYKRSLDIGYEIKIDPMTDDIETKMGKQLTFSTILQYVGGQLSKEDIGKLIKNLPYSNLEESFGDFTLDYENIKNDLLMLDRGQMPKFHADENHPYVIKRVMNRMKKADFDFLPPQIQQNYQQFIQLHYQAEAQAQAKIAAAKSEYLPTGGYLVTVDFYVSDPGNPNKTRRARLPSQAVEWLIQKLETQGMSLQKLEGMDTATKAQIAAQMLSQQRMPQAGMQMAGPGPGSNMNGNGNAGAGVRGSPGPTLNLFERGGGANASPSRFGLR